MHVIYENIRQYTSKGFLVKANLCFDESLLRRVMADYDDDNTGIIDYRKFCENVLDSKPDDAGGWGSSSSGSNARFPGRQKAPVRREPMESVPEGGQPRGGGQTRVGGRTQGQGGDGAASFGLTATGLQLGQLKSALGAGQEEAWRPDVQEWSQKDVRKRQAATRY